MLKIKISSKCRNEQKQTISPLPFARINLFEALIQKHMAKLIIYEFRKRKLLNVCATNDSTRTNYKQYTSTAATSDAKIVFSETL